MVNRILSNRPSPAMVVACIALVVALGGTGYAAIKLPRNSVGAAQLRPNAVTASKVRNGSLTAKDFQASALKRGPRGPQGPKGDPAPGASGARSSLGFASRDLFAANQPFINLNATSADVIGLDAAAGTAGYVASSGRVTADGPSRLIANGEALLVNTTAGFGDGSCRLVLVGSDVRPFGNYVNGQIAAGAYLPIPVSSGMNIEAGTYAVRLQCSTNLPGIQFHRGNLTATVAPR